jgi:hypothetical protein
MMQVLLAQSWLSFITNLNPDLTNFFAAIAYALLKVSRYELISSMSRVSELLMREF